LGYIIDIPVPEGKDVLIKIRARGICGTDLASYRSGVPMGFGHEMSGDIVKVGSASSWKEGTRVFVCNLSQKLTNYAPDQPNAYLGGFAEYILIHDPEKDVDLFELPEGMSYEEGALVEPFCVSMSGVKKAPVSETTKAVIFGAGIIGLGAALCLKHRGATNITIADINDIRLERAEQAGFNPLNTKDVSLMDELAKRYGMGISATKGQVPDVDVYIDAAGVGALVQEAVTNARCMSQLTILAVHKNEVPLNLMNVMYNNLTVQGSLMYSLDDVKEAITIINAHKDIAKTMISHALPFDEAVDAFETADNPNVSIKVMMISD